MEDILRADNFAALDKKIFMLDGVTNLPHLEMIVSQCIRRSRKCFGVLIANNLDCNISLDATGKRPVHLAQELDDVELLDVIYKSGCNLNYKINTGESVLQMSLEKRQIVFFEKLCNLGVDTNQCFSNGEFAIHAACRLPEILFLRILLKSGANVNAVTPNGQTGLHVACAKEKVEHVKVLLSQTPVISVNHKDKRGQSALHIATLTKCSEIIESLVNHDGDLLMPDNNRRTPADTIIDCNDETVVRNVCAALVEKLVDLPMHTTILSRHYYVLLTLLRRIDSMSNYHKTVCKIAKACENNGSVTAELFNFIGKLTTNSFEQSEILDDQKLDRLSWNVFSQVLNTSNTDLLLCLMSNTTLWYQIKDRLQRQINQLYSWSIHDSHSAGALDLMMSRFVRKGELNTEHMFAWIAEILTLYSLKPNGDKSNTGNPICSLITWAIIAEKLDIVPLLLRFSWFDIIPFSLFAASLLYRLSMEKEIPYTVRQRFHEFSKVCESIACSAMRCIAATDMSLRRWICLDYIRFPLDRFGGLSCLDLAARGSCSDFLHMKLCQNALDKCWYRELYTLWPPVREVFVIFAAMPLNIWAPRLLRRLNKISALKASVIKRHRKTKEDFSEIYDIADLQEGDPIATEESISTRVVPQLESRIEGSEQTLIAASEDATLARCAPEFETKLGQTSQSCNIKSGIPDVEINAGSPSTLTVNNKIHLPNRISFSDIIDNKTELLNGETLNSELHKSDSADYTPIRNDSISPSFRGQRLLSFSESMKKKYTEQLEDVLDLMGTPAIKFRYHSAALLIFLILYSYVVMLNFHYHISVAEVVCYLYLLGYLAQELYEIYHLHTISIKAYFTCTWNVIDGSGLIFGFLGFIIRLTVINKTHSYGYGTPEERTLYMARICLCFSLLCYFIRLIYIATVWEKLGPKIQMMSTMIWKDLMPFLFILFVFMLAFGIIFHALLYPNGYALLSQSNASNETGMTAWNVSKIVQNILKLTFYSMMGEYQLEKISGEDCGVYDDYCPHEFGKVAVPLVFMVLYVVIVNLLLLNLVIALFSKTVEDIDAQSQRLWEYERYSVIQEFDSRFSLPPPLNLLCIFSLIITYVYRRVVGSCESTADRRQSRHILYFLLLETFALRHKRLDFGAGSEDSKKPQIDLNIGEQDPKILVTNVHLLTEQISAMNNSITLLASQVANLRDHIIGTQERT